MKYNKVKKKQILNKYPIDYIHQEVVNIVKIAKVKNNHQYLVINQCPKKNITTKLAIKILSNQIY
jgi:hypothetical protein